MCSVMSQFSPVATSIVSVDQELSRRRRMSLPSEKEGCFGCEMLLRKAYELMPHTQAYNDAQKGNFDAKVARSRLMSMMKPTDEDFALAVDAVCDFVPPVFFQAVRCH
jgi:hypothetical protein